MSIATGCKRGGGLCYAPNNQKSTKFQLHNSVKFSNSKPGFDICRLRCSSWYSSPSSSRFSVSKKYETLDKPDPELFLTLLCDEIPSRVYTFTILVSDEHGDLKEKLDTLISRRHRYFDWLFPKLKGYDKTDKAPMVFRETALLLLNNIRHWISSRFMVSSNLKESELKVIKSDQMIPDKVIAPVETATEKWLYHPCTEVIMDVFIGDGPLKGIPIGGAELGFNYKEIRTRGDLKALLHHLIDEEEVVALNMTCRSVSLSKLFITKTKALENYYYSHTTS